MQLKLIVSQFAPSYHFDGLYKVQFNQEYLDEAVTKSPSKIDSAAVSVFVVILVGLTNTVYTNTVFVNSTNITTNIEAAVLSRLE